MIVAPATALARRLVDFVILANDPAVPAATAGYWELSRAVFAHLDADVRDLLACDTAGNRAYASLIDAFADPDRHDALTRRLAALLAADPRATSRLTEAVNAGPSQTWLDYHLGAEYVREVPPVGLDDVLALARERLSPAPRRAPDGPGVHVVIPFRDPATGARTRNLVACLLALRDQDHAHGKCQVTVVEADTRPRHRDLLEGLVDSYLFAPHDGRFNKSWTVNVGVAADDRRARFTCVLDGDFLIDRSFISRNSERLAAGGHTAHVCCRRALFLDEASTAAAIRLRCQERAASTPERILRGVVLRDPPGGALWVRTDAFHCIGGFDERFEGWGGEDEDITRRLGRDGEFRRYDDQLLHMDHPRPPMRTEENQSFNGHVEMMTWTGGNGFGDVAKYSVRA
ncbi:galactosyltransferase-like protein [Streptomyces sp. 846.5]|nr:galactosyltransferase-related protein [Streptomyces sp. 846.5]TDU04461.1 galactosyltransferase-like protein [Streptomyces sp. 846.5]